MAKIPLYLIAAVLLLLSGILAGRYWPFQTAKEETLVLSREGVLQQIQALNRLESTAFYIDTVIQSEQSGNWYLLWQDAQKGLFIARGRVLAGIDLNKITAGNIQLTRDRVILSLPSVEILSVDVERLDVYDLQTGALGLRPVDKAVFAQVQLQAKKQVLESACKAGILNHAQTHTRQQLETLFSLAHSPVSVYPAAVPPCPKKLG